MSYTEIASKPATATLRQVMNAGRSERAPSRATSSGKPRQRLHGFHGTRRRHRANRQIRRAELAPEARHHELLGSSNLSVQATQLTIRALDSRCAAGDASGRHLQPTFQRRAPRFRSATTTARRERRDSRHAARFAQLGQSRGRLFDDHGGGPAGALTPPSPSGARRLPPRIGWPRPLSPPLREERRLPRPETPSTIERLSTNRGCQEPSPAPGSVNVLRQRQSPG